MPCGSYSVLQTAGIATFHRTETPMYDALKNTEELNVISLPHDSTTGLL
jgi:hypothetical protein